MGPELERTYEHSHILEQLEHPHGEDTITGVAHAAGEVLLALIDEVVTHRVNVITDSDWFLERVREAVRETVALEVEL